MSFDLLSRRKTVFALWIPGQVAESPTPQLILGTFVPGPPAIFKQVFKGPLTMTIKDLWELNPFENSKPYLAEGVYHYWFEVQDTSPENLGVVQVTDPLAYNVDYRIWRMTGDKRQPASVVRFKDGELWPCDRDGYEPGRVAIPDPSTIASNNHLVIYELPTSWARYTTEGKVETDIGTFTDVMALFDANVPGDNFSSVAAISQQAILSDLGVNALELLPAADARPTGSWGYATANYFATDLDLGTATSLVKLVDTIHNKNVRFFTDIVMAFGHDPYIYIDYDQFHIDPKSPKEFRNDERWQSHTPHTDDSQLRDGYGGRSWRYNHEVATYDPESGDVKVVYPARVFHKANLHRWMSDFGVGGLRLDSVNNIASYDFVRSYKDHAVRVHHSRYTNPQDSKFLVIGEELSCPLDLLTTNTLQALWNEPFQARLRAAILGEATEYDFSTTVRKMVDCRRDTNHPFWDGAQAINYITSHDTEGYRKERLYNFLSNNGVTDMERRVKFAFALLLTSVGIPMIFAGEEFVDQHDRDTSDKQIDPVNYERRSEDWRSRIFKYVSILIRFRKECPALGDNDTDFFFVDESRGGKVMAWNRGGVGREVVVVVANFTGEDLGMGEGQEYVVNGWPEREKGGWREVTTGREVSGEWVGREPLGAWECMVYTRWRE
ncbi:uncharacterized protein RSE6_11099 [Rhynchosporium secalis]|uniref:Glycosyl hydrolase family 13 catalytic domain-containing protein n=1 Tax=Rhynchosporium secalis TaxID=38038 RepID=A0A1E1MM41_RHYSE|nr:uncharacterized protein RSE6_11099 [Rhynchosporium secalis]